MNNALLSLKQAINTKRCNNAVEIDTTITMLNTRKPLKCVPLQGCEFTGGGQSCFNYSFHPSAWWLTFALNLSLAHPPTHSQKAWPQEVPFFWHKLDRIQASMYPSLAGNRTVTFTTSLQQQHMSAPTFTHEHTYKGPFTHEIFDAISDVISRTKRALPYPARIFSRSIAWTGKKVITYYWKKLFFPISANLRWWYFVAALRDPCGVGWGRFYTQNRVEIACVNGP